MVFFELFSHNPTIIKIKAGAALFQEGDEGRMMYVLATGNADVLVGNRVVEQLQHGSIVGEISIVLPGPRSASVVARTDCRLWRWTKNASSSSFSRRRFSPFRSCASWPNACAGPIRWSRRSTTSDQPA